jgi:hypothetical protein
MTDKRAKKRLMLGYWHEKPNDGYAHPQPLVDYAWESARRDRIVHYLKTGFEYSYSMGFSWCRFGCTEAFLERTNDPSKGTYRKMQHSFLVIADGVQKTEVQDVSGYYLTRPGPLPNGCTQLCDDMWCWPEGLAHYVENHGIRLPDEFVAHAAERGFEPTAAFRDHFTPDHGFWKSWCEVHAPFTYEPRCMACTGARWSEW